MIKLESFYKALAEVFDGPEAIESFAREALLEHAPDAVLSGPSSELPASVLDVMAANDAHTICKLIANLPFNWTPPQTSGDPLYIQHSLSKVHVELIGPTGLKKSSDIRLGLYGMVPYAEYGVRTHPAEEIYLMLAGKVFWKRGADRYLSHDPGERSFHPSMMEHANRTGDVAFMSVYVWRGDISTDRYVYNGLPAD